MPCQHILVVSPEPSRLDLARTSLEQVGFDVDAFDSHALPVGLERTDHEIAVDRTSNSSDAVRLLLDQLATVTSRLEASERRFRTLLDSGEAIAMLTTDGVLLDVNKRWEEVLDLPRGELVGRHIREFAPIGQEDEIVLGFHERIGPQPPRVDAVPIRRRDGELVFMEFATKRLTIEEREVVFTIGHDVTESVSARKELIASEARYRALIDNLPDIVWVSTLDGKTVFVSPHVSNVCGYTAEELTTAAPDFWVSRIHPEERESVVASYRDVTSGVFEREYRWQAKNGEWIWLHSRARLRVGEDGIRFAEGTFADVTERKRLEEQVRQSQKMEAIGQLTGGIAHDFNNILAVIIGNGEYLEDSLAEADPLRQDVQSVLQAAQKAAGLTRQLLAFSRNQILEPRDIDLNETVKGIEKMLGRVIGEDIELCVRAREAPALVRADQGQVEQVIMNMAVNARDAMPRGGRLSICTSLVDLTQPRRSRALGVPPGPYVALTIADTGDGMDAATMRRIFEPFFTTKGVGRGTGLGLSTCYGIVKQSGGTISVSSDPGQGAVFKVFFPQIVTPKGSERSAQNEGAAPGGSETILLIEDDAEVRATLRRMLTRRGYRLLEAHDGAAAISVGTAHDGPIDLILSDVVMPGVSGPDAVRALETKRGTANVLFMSGFTDHPALRGELLRPGVHCIQKPFSASSVARKIREVLDGGKAVSASGMTPFAHA